MSAPRLLDLFCCEGGAAAGYIAAGFDVHGVDLEAKYERRYPSTFTCDDALAYAMRHGREYDVIHSSPPCQGYSIATAGNAARSKHARLIAITRQVLDHIGVPYVIENVAQARSEMVDPMLLCGTMFGLKATDDDGIKLEMWRHRLFESNVPLAAAGTCDHGWHSAQVAGSYGGARRDKDEARNVRHGGYVPAKHVQEKLLGIDWMTQFGLYQSLPPVYTQHVGLQLMAHVSEVAA
jgi:DNA (cytosine-5)-methyltransferase 1